MSYSQFQYCYYQSIFTNNLMVKYYDSRHNSLFVLNTLPLYFSHPACNFNHLIGIPKNPKKRKKFRRYRTQFSVWQPKSLKTSNQSKVSNYMSTRNRHVDVHYSFVSPNHQRLTYASRIYLSTVHYSTNRLTLAAITPSITPCRRYLLLQLSAQLYFQFAHLSVTHYWLTSSFLHQIVRLVLPKFTAFVPSAVTISKSPYALLSLVRNLKLL